MNLAADTLVSEVRAAGGTIVVKSGRLKLFAPSPLPTALMERIKEAKPILLVALQPSSWSTAEWKDFYNERACIAEHYGCMGRNKAERMAYESCITRWLDTHPPAPHTNGAICPYCQQPNGVPGASCVPTLSGNGGHLWLHHVCLDPWRVQRRREAITALASIELFSENREEQDYG